MSASILLKDLFKHKIRKQIIKNNKHFNHKAFVKSLQLGQKIPFLMRYHKKKLIFSILLGIITWTYSLHKNIYYWLRTMRPPHLYLLSFIIQMPQQQTTLLQMSQILKIQLSSLTQQILLKLFYQTDKYLYFGVGRKYLFEVYYQLGLIQTEEEQRMYWQKSEFFKKRNQLAAGIGLVEYLHMFQEALKKKKEKQPEYTQSRFLSEFINKFIQKAPQIVQWQKTFNSQRQKQFLKNTPGMLQIKKQTISDIIKQKPQISYIQLESTLKNMGLKGLNLTQKYFYYRSREVYLSMNEMNLTKLLSNPRVQMDGRQKNRIMNEIEKNKQKLEEIRKINEEILGQHVVLYEKEML